MIKYLQRQLVCFVAKSQLGLGDATKYWNGIVAKPYPASWCGAFCLWCYHRVGVARGVNWLVGTGFLYRYPTTTSPQKGDVAYFLKYQHEAMVVGVSGEDISLINGNGNGAVVTRGTVKKSAVTAFYNVIG